MALALARRFGARLNGLHVVPEPDVPPYFKPSAIERIAALYAENAREAASQAEALFRDEIKDAGVVTAWECMDGDMEEMIAECARFSDLLVLGQFDTENPPTISAFLLPAKVVFGAAAPILVVPTVGSCADIGRRALVAWDGSREAARAIRDAMPLLAAAERVLLLGIDPLRQGHMREGLQMSSLVAHLSRHGVQTEQSEVSSGNKSVTDGLLERASAFHADVLVMGAYGHSRIWEFVIGGTTQALLERTTIPVLISR